MFGAHGQLGGMYSQPGGFGGSTFGAPGTAMGGGYNQPPQQFGGYNGGPQPGATFAPPGMGPSAGQDDELYEGFNQPAPAPQFPPGTASQGGFGGGYGQVTAPPGMGPGMNYPPPPTGHFQPINPLQSRMGPQSRMQSRGGPAGDGDRPMTAVRGAGYSSAGAPPPGTAAGGGQPGFDPLNQAGRGPAPPLAEKEPATPEEQCLEMEKEVNKLMEESAIASAKGDYLRALEKAKEAGKKERALCKRREASNLVDQINYELTHAVCFNLAHQYHANGMLTEALNTYNIIVKNKQFAGAGRLRVNMGNIYFEQKAYSNAIKCYRMALDQVGNAAKDMRLKIMRNIGIAFFRLGQYVEAVESFETIMDGNADLQTGFNLVIGYYLLGNKEKMKSAFVALLHVRQPGTEEDEEEEEEKEEDIVDQDDLGEEVKQRQQDHAKKIVTAARILAPAIEKDFAAGYDWIVDILKNNGFHNLAGEVEIVKSVTFLKEKQFKSAVETLMEFEKKDKSLLARASTNLSFLYFLKGNVEEAEKYANMAIEKQQYNSKAIVNKGNCLLRKDNLQAAKEKYEKAIRIESDCTEALFNLGLVHKQMDQWDEAYSCFQKIHHIVPNQVQVMYQLGDCLEKSGRDHEAQRMFTNLATRLPTDASLQARLGQLSLKLNDDVQAFHYFLESYRLYPVNMDVIIWLGKYWIENDMYEKAIPFFNRAAEIQSSEVKWKLMAASCTRRIGDTQKALQIYEAIFKQAPNNLECLRYLGKVCEDLGMREKANHYKGLMAKAAKFQDPQVTSGMQTSTLNQGGFNNINKDESLAALSSGKPKPKPQALSSAEESNNHQMGAFPKHDSSQKGGKGKKQEEDDWEDEDLDLPM